MMQARILVVDDSTSVRKVLERLLSSRGMHVVAAESAEQGLQVASDSNPDLVIADVVMPGMSGFELCQLLKMNKRFSSIPVILISGIVNESVLSQAQEVGAFAVVPKPFTPDELFPKVESALSNAAPASSPPPATHSAPVPPVTVPPVTQSMATSPAAAPQREPAPAPISTPVPAPMPRGSNLQAELQPFMEKTEVQSALLFSSSGEALAMAGKLEDSTTLAAYCRTLASISNVLGERFSLGNSQGMSLEYQGHNLLLHRISEKASLALVVQGTSATGVVRYLILKQAPQIRQALEGLAAVN
jgi:CheY-like chemotaxis protein